MKKLFCLVAALTVLVLGTNAVAGPFGAGNIVIVRVGDGSQILTNYGNTVFLDEYTTNAIWAAAGGFTPPTPVQTIQMPTNWVGGQAPLLLEGFAPSEGVLSRSADGRFLLLTGFGATLGQFTGSLASATTTGLVDAVGFVNQAARVVGLVDGSGHVYTSTAQTNANEEQEAPRSAVSTDGTNIWLAGDTSGIKYLTRGSLLSTQVVSGNVRVDGISSNVLYECANHVLLAATNTALAVNPFGGSLPTSSVKSNFTLLAGVLNNTATSSAAIGSPWGFALFNLNGGAAPDTLYIADNVTNAPGEPIGHAGGVLKYCYIPASNAWVHFGYIYAEGAQGLTGVQNGTNVTLYITEGGTSTPAELNVLYPYVDSSGFAHDPASNPGGPDANVNSEPLLPSGAGDGTRINTRGIALAPVGGDAGTISGPGVMSVGPTYGPTFHGPAGGPFLPSNFVYSVANLGTTTTNFVVQFQDSGGPVGGNWLTISPTSGTLLSGQSMNVTVTPNGNAAAIADNGGFTYKGTIKFKNGNGVGTTFAAPTAALIDFALFVTPAADFIDVGPVGAVGGLGTSNFVYTVSNATAGVKTWSAGLTNAFSWDSLSATGGVLNGGASTNITVSMTASANTLSLGTYEDTIVFSNVSANAQLLTHKVVLQVGFGIFDDFSVGYANGNIVGQNNWFNPSPGLNNNPYQVASGVLVLPAGVAGCTDVDKEEPAKNIAAGTITNTTQNPLFVYFGMSLIVTSAPPSAATWDFTILSFTDIPDNVTHNEARTSVNDIGGGKYRWNTHVNGFDSLVPGTIGRNYNQKYNAIIVEEVANSNCWVFVDPPNGDTNTLFAMTPDTHDGPDVGGWFGPSTASAGAIDIDNFCSGSAQAGYFIYKLAVSTNYTDVYNWLTAVAPPPDQFTTWQNTYFTPGELSNPSFSGPNADPLGKGMSNTNQFLTGFNPTNSAAYLHIISIVKTNGNDVRVTYLGANGDNTWSPGFASRTNVLEYTAGTGNGSYSTNNFASTGQTNILTGGTGLGVITNMVDPNGATNAPSRYYRIRVLVP